MEDPHKSRSLGCKSAISSSFHPNLVILFFNQSYTYLYFNYSNSFTSLKRNSSPLLASPPSPFPASPWQQFSELLVDSF